MRKMSFILLLGIVLLFAACSNGGMMPPREVKLDSHFSLSVPKNYRMRNDLHDFAPLQMADEANGYFLLAIEESKLQLQQRQLYYSLSDYAYFMQSTIAKGYDTIHVSERDTFEHNNLHFQSIDMYASIFAKESPLEVYYRMSAIETEERFYQLIGWSRRKKTDELREAMLEMEKSFQELLPESPNRVQQASALRPE